VRRIVSILIEMELCDAAILDGEVAEETAALAIPLFSSLRDLFGGETAWRKIIVTPVKDLQTVQKFLQLCRPEGIDFRREGVRVGMALPCAVHVSHE